MGVDLYEDSRAMPTVVQELPSLGFLRSTCDNAQQRRTCFL